MISTTCEGCQLSKQSRLFFSKNSEIQATKPFKLIHIDICGPFSMTSLSGSKYFVTFIDDFFFVKLGYIYEETFAPIVRWGTIRTLVALIIQCE